MFSKNIQIVYLYLVCFITLMMTIGGVIATVNAVAKICLPVVHIPYSHLRETNHSDESIADEIAAHTENERIRSLRSFFNSIIVWIVALPIFMLHWKRISKEKENIDDHFEKSIS